MTALIGFVREFTRELERRASGLWIEASSGHDLDGSMRCAIVSLTLREIAGAITAASKATLLA